MKVAPRQIASFLARPPDKICAILFHGNDAGLRSTLSHQLASLYSDDLDDIFSVTRINGSSLNGEPGKILDAAAEISMLDVRLVIVKATGTELLDACKLLLAQPIRHAKVIIDATDTTAKHAVVKLFEATDNAAAVGCYHDNNIDIKHLATSILMKDKVSIAKDALNLICSRLGGDHAATRSELEKLALLAGPGGHLNLKTVSEALGDSAILAIDDIASAVADGQVLALSSALGKAWLEDANCVMIIRGCQNYFSQLRVLSHATNTGQSTQSAVRSLRPPVHFKLQDTLIRHTKRWQPRHCLNVINRLQDIEIKLKSKTINDRTLTAQALLGLCLRAK